MLTTSCKQITESLLAQPWSTYFRKGNEQPNQRKINFRTDQHVAKTKNFYIIGLCSLLRGSITMFNFF